MHAQKPKADSLKLLLSKQKEDTVKVMLYYQYGDLFEDELPDTAHHYYEKAKTLSQQLDFKKGQALYSTHAIVILNKKGKFREALDLTKEALSLYEQLGSKKDLAIAYLNVGSEWHYLSDFKTAAENYLQSKKIAEEINDVSLQRKTNNNLASIFLNLQEYEKGKAYAEKSLQFAKELKNEYAISSSTFNIAVAELYLKQYDQALMHYQQVEAIGIKTDDYIVILDGWLGTGDVYSAMVNAAKAILYYNKVIALAKEKEAPEYEMYAWMGLSELHIKTNQYAAAEKAVANGIALAKELGSMYELKDLYLRAADLNEKTGQFKEALSFRKQFEILNDSVVGEKSKSSVNLLEARFESEKKVATIQQLESDKKIQELTIKQKDNLNYIMIGVVTSVVVISLMYYAYYLQRQRLQRQRIHELETEKQLMAAEAVLQGEEQERTRMAKDLHDGLGGILSGIKHSLNTMKGNMIMTPDNHQAFERSIDMLDSSIKEMRRVAHNMMPEALIRFGLNTALRDFCNDINQSGIVKVSYISIGLEDVIIDQTTSVTVYRIVQELIHNTMKHAAATSAIVQITKSDTQLLVTVEDNGKGFDTTSLKAVRGIGWTNIQHRVDFLKGRIEVTSAAGEGTSVHIEFNI